MIILFQNVTWKITQLQADAWIIIFLFKKMTINFITS